THGRTGGLVTLVVDEDEERQGASTQPTDGQSLPVHDEIPESAQIPEEELQESEDGIELAPHWSIVPATARVHGGLGQYFVTSPDLDETELDALTRALCTFGLLDGRVSRYMRIWFGRDLDLRLAVA